MKSNKSRHFSKVEVGENDYVIPYISLVNVIKPRKSSNSIQSGKFNLIIEMSLSVAYLSIPGVIEVTCTIGKPSHHKEALI